jgi:hypothetical protein
LQGFLGGARAWNSLQCCNGFRDFEAASKVMQGLSRTRRELCSDRCQTGGQDKSQKVAVFNKLNQLDAYPKISEDFYSRTLSGGIITLVSSIFMVLLFITEFRK